MKTINDAPDFLSLAQVAKRLKVSRIAVYKRIKSGSLKAFRVGRSYIVAQEALGSFCAGGLAQQIDLSDMRFTDRLSEAMKKAVWEYDIAPRELFDILMGAKSTFTFNQAKLLARVLATTDWYSLINIFGRKRLKIIINDNVLSHVWNKDMRKRLIFAKGLLDEK
jgi:excisionase family DNA binding protein